MSETSLTLRSGFTRIVLPQVLFSRDDLSLLLAQRYAQPFVQSLWREYCGKMDAPAAPEVEALNTTAMFLGSRVGSVIFMLPAPQSPGEAYLAQLVVPALPQDGPRRYFTLEMTPTPAAGNLATALSEWVPEPGSGNFRQVHCRDGVKPEPQALFEAVEQITGLTSKPVETAPPAQRPWWQFWR